MFVADDLSAWLVSLLADAGRKRLSTMILGTEQERALRKVATTAILLTARDLSSGDADRVEQLAMVVGQVFGKPEPITLQNSDTTLLEVLQAGVAKQLAVLADTGRTGVGQSSAEVLGVSIASLTDELINHLIREILGQGSRGGPLAPLANQLNHDVTHLQGKRVEGVLGDLVLMIQSAVIQLQDSTLARVSPSEHGAMAGQMIAELTDPFALEVHRAIAVPEAIAERAMPQLPPYIARDHDARLAETVRRGEQGQSAICVLVGGSSTGKTRACWEAIQALPPGWRLWHPIFPDRPEAFMAQLDRVGQRTVVWMNEAQLYLLTADPREGERVAAGLRELLRSPGRRPVLVLGTIWPEYWQSLTIRPPGYGTEDLHEQARQLLAGSMIEVPEAFTGTALTAFEQAADLDPRLAEAFRKAEAGQVTQFLAGAPALLERYRSAPPAAKAVIDTAIDARRLGHGSALAYSLLNAAAPAYFTDQQWEQAGDQWFERALAYTSAPCNGVRGPVTRIRPRPEARASGATESLSQQHDEEHGQYRLADYIEQTGRHDRDDKEPPMDLWEALLAHANPADLPAIAKEAGKRRLYKYESLLHKQAIEAGHPAVPLLRWVERFDPQNIADADVWCASHSNLKDPFGVALLVDHFHDARAWEALAILFARSPATEVSLADQDAITRLLGAWSNILVDPSVPPLPPVTYRSFTFAQRAAVREADKYEAVVLLGRGVIGRVDISDPDTTAGMLRNLRLFGAGDAITELLARRPEAYVEVSDPGAVAHLLDALHEVGDANAVKTLAARAVRHARLDNHASVLNLLDALNRAGASTEAATLLGSSVIDQARQLELSATRSVAAYLQSFHKLGAEAAVAALLARDPAAHVDITDTKVVVTLLTALHQAGAEAAVAALLARDPAAHVDLSPTSLMPLRSLENLYSYVHPVACLISLLGRLGAHDALATLLNRHPESSVNADDILSIGSFLEALRAAGCNEAVGSFAEHVARTYPVGNRSNAERLIRALRAANADTASALLASRAAAEPSVERVESPPFSQEPGDSLPQSWGWRDLGVQEMDASSGGENPILNYREMIYQGITVQGQQPIYILKDIHSGTCLRVQCDFLDGLSLYSAEHGISRVHSSSGDEYCFSYDLICGLLMLGGIRLLNARITAVENEVLFSDLTLSSGIKIDAKSASSVGLAVWADAPILVASHIIDKDGVPIDQQDQREQGPTPRPIHRTLPEVTVQSSTALSAMKLVKFAGIQMEDPSQPIILLSAQQHDVSLRVRTTPAEVTAILHAVQQQQTLAHIRGTMAYLPMASPAMTQNLAQPYHDLFCSILNAAKIKLEAVSITHDESGDRIFTLVFSGGHAIRSRPGDAIALAIRLEATLLASSRILEEARVANAPGEPGQ